MAFLHYGILSPIRLLLVLSAVFLIIPCIFKNELMNYYSFPVFYFFGSYFFFINFPIIGETMHGKPTYVEDLVVTMNGINDHSFKKKYSVIMNFVLALLFSMFAEYIIIQGIKERSIIEILGIIGGNLSLYMKTQNTMGKFLLEFCNCMKTKEISRRLSLDINTSPSITSVKDEIMLK